MSVAGHSPIEFLSLTRLPAFFPLFLTIGRHSATTNIIWSVLITEMFLIFLIGCLIYSLLTCSPTPK